MTHSPQAALLLDPAVVEQLGELLGDSLAHFIETFLDDTAAQIVAMENALQAGDTVELGRRAHSLRSSSAAMGAARLGLLCAALETRIRDGATADSAGQDVGAINAAFCAAQPLYARMIKTV